MLFQHTIVLTLSLVTEVIYFLPHVLTFNLTLDVGSLSNLFVLAPFTTCFGLTFDFGDGGEFVLEGVAEGLEAAVLEVAGVLSALGGVVAALAHAGMVAQATLVQVRVRQGICGGDSFLLKIQQKMSS